MQLATIPSDLLRRLDRLRHAPGGERGDSASLPAILARRIESEADKLGLQYMYKTGYDPNAFVDFFEKLQSLEKKKPGTMAKVFSDHPPTGTRIVAVQKNIQEHLKERPEYVVTTSEFNDVKGQAAGDAQPPRPTKRWIPTSRI